jgi:transposase
MRNSNIDLEKLKILASTNTKIELSKIFNVHRDTIKKILQKNNIIPHKSDHKHTDETKQKLSDIRKKFLKENPDKHPWRSNNKFKSIPCEKIKEWLKSKNIQFIEEYSVPNISNNFSIDIAFPDKLIGIEINGNQHYNTDGTLKEYYQKRHDIIKSYGWNLIELHYSIAFHINDFELIIKQLLNSETKLTFDYNNYIRPKITIKQKSSTPLKKYNYPSINILKELYSNLTLKELSEKLKIPIPALASKLNRYNIKKHGSSVRNPTGNFSLEVRNDMQFHHGATSKLDWRNNPRPNCRKVLRPDKSELETLIQQFPMTTLAKRFNVSDNAIRKWCKYYEINLPNRLGYWSKIHTH